MATGMSLRMTYQGEAMAWVDSPACAAQACSGEKKGDVVHSLEYFHGHGWGWPSASMLGLRGSLRLAPSSTVSFAPPTKRSWWSSFPMALPTRQISNPRRSPPPAVDLTKEREVESLVWAPDTDALWQCYHVTGDHDKTALCATTGIQKGCEFEYTAGRPTRCHGCRCCKRQAKLMRIDILAGDDMGWIVNDPSDPLDGHIVPADVTADDTLFVKFEDHGVVEWRDSQHFVRRVRVGTPYHGSLCEVADRSQAHRASTLLQSSPSMAAQDVFSGVVVWVQVAMVIILGAVSCGILRRCAHDSLGCATVASRRKKLTLAPAVAARTACAMPLGAAMTAMELHGADSWDQPTTSPGSENEGVSTGIRERRVVPEMDPARSLSFFPPDGASPEVACS